MYKTSLNKDKIAVINKSIREVWNLPGSTAEIGVYEGGISRMIAESLPNKIHWAVDTFTGMVKVGQFDARPNDGINDFSDIDFNEVKEYLNLENIRILKGVFPLVCDGQEIEKHNFCLVHFDADTYYAIKYFILFFWPRMVEGGIMIFDDYDRACCPGVLKGIKEFLYFDKTQSIKIEETTKGQCIIRRKA